MSTRAAANRAIQTQHCCPLTAGAKLACGGKRWGDRGYYLEPTVFCDVQAHMAIAKGAGVGPGGGGHGADGQFRCSPGSWDLHAIDRWSIA